jgi:hypothetical protein
MKMHVLAGLTALALVALGAPSALAHQHRGGHHACSGCSGAGSHECGCPGCACDTSAQPGAQRNDPPDRGYDADTVTTLRGTATAVAVVPARGGRAGGSHLVLESDGKATEVHLGPSWFLEQQGITVSKGDVVQVTGSLVEQDGTTFLIAREIRKGAKVVTLRDERGVPAWSGGPRR